MMCKLKVWMEKGGQYVVQMKRWMQKSIMMWKSRWMDTQGIIISKLKGEMDKGEHYDVEIKGWMQKRAIWCAN